MTQSTSHKAQARFVAVALGAVAVGLAGYFGYSKFVGGDRLSEAALMALAGGTGFAAFFSPCSFPLLLTFLTRRSAESPNAAVVSGIRVAIGAALLMAILAALVAATGAAVASVVSFDSTAGRLFRTSIGGVLIVLGLRQTGVLRLRTQSLDTVAGYAARRFAPITSPRSARTDIVYGFGYLLAGFG